MGIDVIGSGATGSRIKSHNKLKRDCTQKPWCICALVRRGLARRRPQATGEEKPAGKRLKKTGSNYTNIIVWQNNSFRVVSLVSGVITHLLYDSTIVS